MATTETDGAFGLTDRRNLRGDPTGEGPLADANEYKYIDNQALDGALTAVSSTTFSAARLASMTKNDKIYALRFTNDVAGMFR
jgi:hypothetical protein